MAKRVWWQRQQPAPRQTIQMKAMAHLNHIYVPDMERLWAKAALMALVIGGRRPIYPRRLDVSINGATSFCEPKKRTICLGMGDVLPGGISEDFHLVHELLHLRYPGTTEARIKALEAPSLKRWYKITRKALEVKP